MKMLFQKLITRGRSVRDKVEQYQDAITFSEAGGQSGDSEAVHAGQAEEQPGVLLVIGDGNRFTRRIMDYALEMAQRMSYEILALNIAPLPEESFAFLAPSRSKIKEFEESSRENIRSFQEAAQQAGIGFHHTVRFGQTDAIIAELGKEYGQIEFVVAEPEKEQAAQRPETENRPENQLQVYSMV